MIANINLLPEEIVKKRRKNINQMIWLIRFLAVIFLLGTLYGLFFSYDYYLEKHLQSLQADFAQQETKLNLVRKLAAENKELKGNIELLEDISEDQTLWYQILTDINQIMPQDIWLESFECSDGKSIQFAGNAGNLSSVGILLYELNQLDYVVRFDLLQAKNKVVNDQNRVEFYITGNLK